MKALRSPAILVSVLLFAAAAGVFAGYVDLHNDEVQAAVLVIAVATFLLSLFRPRAAWMVALLVGAGVPAAHIWARATGFVVPYPVDSLWGTALAFVPAFLGACAGAGLRWGAALFAR